MKESILIVDDEEHIRRQLGEFLESKYSVHTASTMEEAKKVILHEPLQYAIIDLKLDNPSEYAGVKVFLFLKQTQPGAKFIILSAYPFEGEVEEEFDAQLKNEPEAEKMLYEVKNNYISKGGEKNYILAVLSKLERLKTA